jgi:metal-responsive CopG/Arc/MetJ family transcriptional regulator
MTTKAGTVIKVDAAQIERIDRLRGYEPRTNFVRRMLEKALTNEEKKEKGK